MPPEGTWPTTSCTPGSPDPASWINFLVHRIDVAPADKGRNRRRLEQVSPRPRTRRGAIDQKSNQARTVKIFIILLLNLGFDACPALAQVGKAPNERARSVPIKGPLRQSRNPNYFQDASG